MVFGSQGLYQSNLIACGSQHLPCLIKTMASRSSLGVQWLRLHASAAGGTGLIPNAAQTKHKQKQNKANKQKSKLQKKTKSNGFLRRFEPPDCKPSKAPRPMVCSCTWWFLLFFCLVKISAQVCPVSHEQLPDSWNNLWLMSPRRVCISDPASSPYGLPW